MKSNRKKSLTKEPVKLRTRTLKNGNIAYYFAYSKNGKWEYEFLGKEFYLIPERTTADAHRNKEVKRLIDGIKAKKIVELTEQSASNFKLNINKAKKVNLIGYVLKIADKALSDTGNKHGDYYNFCSLAYHLKIYNGNEDVTFQDIDAKYITGFINYLKSAKNGNYKKQKEKTISKNGAHKLFAKFTTVIKKALKDKIISDNPLLHIDDSIKPKTEPSKRQFLTEIELKALYSTPCERDDVKRAFLFCCLVGIRYSNVKNITWGDLYDDEGGKKLSYRQIKTGTYETTYVSDEALKFLPEKKTENNPGNTIFDLPKNETANKVLKKWHTEAGITKPITFHCSRHTAATLNLTLGTPIEVVSKLLGHSKISTTTIYAKIIDKSKRDAVQKQDGLFSGLMD